MRARRATLHFAGAMLLAVVPGCAGPGAAAGRQQPREVWGFTAFWDTLSRKSAARNGASLDGLVTTWIALDTAGRLPAVLFVDSSKAPRVPERRLALITSYLHPSFRPSAIRRLAANPRGLARAASSIAATMASARHRGAVLDFEDLAPGDFPALAAVVRTLSDTLRTRGLGPVVVAVPAGDTAAYPGRALLEAGTDFLLPMLYDQHWAGGGPGPVSAPKWVDSTLRTRIREVGASRIIAGLPLYGYRWPSAGKGVTVTFAEASAAAAGSLARDEATGTLHARLAGGGEVWVTDATLLKALVTIAEAQGVRRFALWYVGQEDPSVWRTLFERSGGKHGGL
ncbi:MAG TPA: hypothetical protein VJZ25_09395 [Gemmatimonadaceae bacterium]|nr:hypothetical protein [Gemmatimonadaceae bacterium]